MLISVSVVVILGTIVCSIGRAVPAGGGQPATQPGLPDRAQPVPTLR